MQLNVLRVWARFLHSIKMWLSTENKQIPSNDIDFSKVIYDSDVEDHLEINFKKLAKGRNGKAIHVGLILLEPSTV